MEAESPTASFDVATDAEGLLPHALVAEHDVEVLMATAAVGGGGGGWDA